MGIGIIIVGVLMGATTGIVGATIVTLGLITLPALMRRGYHLPTACGTICASGTLGQIIPPSTILILLADILGQSVGTLFAAALFPGLVLSAIFCIYLLLLGIVRPGMVPPVALDERQAMSRDGPVRAALRIGLPPISLVLAVLGSIIGGVAAPTEAASMGALGSILVVVLGGPLQLLGAARNGARHHPHHRRHDVHPDLRAGVRAGLPRPARREAGRGPVQRRAGRRQRRPDLHDGC